MGKLDATTTQPAGAAAAAPGGVAVVNGPEGDDLDWQRVDWRQVQDDVRRLRHRIFTASQAGDTRRVRNLQKLMLRSRANALLSVRRVTEVNAGRETAGIDGELALAPPAKAELATRVQCRGAPWIPKPVKRVYVAKANGKRRPLGIPVIADRCLQALTVNALEPEWEARFEPRSYGFRPGRGCQDAITAIYWTVNGRTPKRLWVLDADLAAAFDRLDHDHILASLGTFPARELIKRWLKAGVVERGWFSPTERGTPQGGPASPVLLNVALHGMENAAGVRYRPTGSQGLGTEPGCPAVIRYADDLVAFCHSREQAEQVKARLAAWLAPRELAFNEEKTRIVHLADGCDFLGFNVRRYRDKLLIKPSTTAMRRIRERLTAEMRALRGANAEAVIQRLNPIIRGWSAYYRGMVSSRAFGALDTHVWRLVHKWAKYSHPNKSKNWIIARYFGVFNKSRRDRWVFGDKDSGAYLVKFAWTKIVRHQMVRGAASADDPALADYWTTRRRRTKPPLDRASLRLLIVQRGRCPICGDFLLHADHEPQDPHEWEQWIKVTRKAVRKQAIAADRGTGTPGAPVALRLLHAHCARRHLVDYRASPPLLPAQAP